MAKLKLNAGLFFRDKTHAKLKPGNRDWCAENLQHIVKEFFFFVFGSMPVNRTRVAVTSARCAINELHTSLKLKN